jgi:PAS domain S-box-containing protein
MKLRNKIALSTSTIMLAVGLVMAVALSQIVEHALNKQLEDKGLSLIKLAAEDIANPLLDGELLTVQRMLEAVVATGGGIEYAFVTSVHGNQIIHTFAGGFPPGLSSANLVTAEHSYTAKVVQTTRGPVWDIGVKILDGLDSELHIGFSQNDILLSLKNIMNTVFGVTLAGLFLGVLAALFISSRVTLPLGRLADHVSQMGEGELTEIKWTKGRDEISDLASCFNRMTRQLSDTIRHIRVSEENYRMLIEAASDAGEGIVLLDVGEGSVAEAKVCYANDEYTRITGYSRDELLGMPFARIVHPDNTTLVDNLWREGQLDPDHPRRFETAIVTKRGEKVYLETSVGATEFQGGKAIICFNRDITDKKRSELVRSQLIRKVIDAQEDERKRIARELHDETSQSLAALVVGIKTVETMVRTRESGAELVLEDLKDGANAALKELHHIIYDLRPSLLDDLGLIPALRWYTDAKLAEHGIEAVMEVTGTPRRLSPEIEIAVFRIVQEAYTNILKYSGASRASLMMDYGIKTLTIAIEDDGCGFDVGSVLDNPNRRGLGLLGMRERVELLDGNFTIQSSVNSGTKIDACIPVKGGKARGRQGSPG